MNTKILVPTTIAPLNLYVEREADRQVEKIINVMGRPGYVLVARQMGKTNLFLNAVRKLQQVDDAFVYADLSNSFTNLRECFRSIVDTAISMHAEKFEAASLRISELRQRKGLPAPHLEHEMELKELLKAIPGKMVIFLDEIDALTKSDFSDELFAKIRSLYMMKEVIPIFKKLTYLLSGVAEPSDLIKNKALSPFNIGEKIYLEPFTHSEYEAFLGKAGLVLDADVCMHIYSQTGGNPRMLWDICSEVEDMCLEARHVSINDVDKIIDRLYLSSFDRAPVDHIRKLIMNDHYLRDAITVLRYGKGADLADEIKRRLYLCGITGPYDKGRPVAIACPIIDASISATWIESLEVVSEDKIELALLEFDNEKYSEFLALVPAVLEDPSLTSGALRKNIMTMAGLACQYMGNYRDAIEWLNKSDKEVAELPINVFYNSCHRATALWYEGNHEASAASFRDTIERCPSQEIRFVAMVEFSFLAAPFEGRYLIKKDFLEHYYPIIKGGLVAFEKMLDKATQLLLFVIDKITIKHLRRKSLLLVMLGDQLTGQSDAVAGQSKRLIADVKPLDRCFFRWLLTAMEVDSDKRKRGLSEICQELQDIGFHVAKPLPSEPYMFDMESLGLLVVHCLRNDMHSEITDLVNSIDLPARYPNALYMILDLARTLCPDYPTEYVEQICAYMASRLAADYREDDLIQLEILRGATLLLLALDRLSVDIIERYFLVFDRFMRPDLLTSDDLSIFYRFCIHLINIDRSGRVRALVSKINRFRDKVSLEVRSYYLFIDFAELLACQIEHDLKRQFDSAKRILNAGPLPDMHGSSLLGLTGSEMEIRARALSVLQRDTNFVESAPANFPRNKVVVVRYENGQTVKVKYKKIEQDLRSGKCKIIDS